MARAAGYSLLLVREEALSLLSIELQVDRSLALSPNGPLPRYSD